MQSRSQVAETALNRAVKKYSEFKSFELFQGVILFYCPLPRVMRATACPLCFRQGTRTAYRRKRRELVQGYCYQIAVSSSHLELRRARILEVISCCWNTVKPGWSKRIGSGELTSRAYRWWRCELVQGYWCYFIVTLSNIISELLMRFF